MRIEKHLVALRILGGQPECPACTQLCVRNIESPVETSDEHILVTPVELEGLTQGERHRNIGCSLWVLVGVLLPDPYEGTNTVLAALVVLCLDRLEQRQRRAQVASRAVAICLQLLSPLICPGIDSTLRFPLGLLQLCYVCCSKPFADGVTRQTCPSLDFSDGKLVVEIHPPNLGKHAHLDYSCCLCSKNEQKFSQGGSNFSGSYGRNWGGA